MNNLEEQVELVMMEVRNRLTSMRLKALMLQGTPKEIAFNSVRNMVEDILSKVKSELLSMNSTKVGDLLSQLYYCEGFLAGLGLDDK